MSVLLAACTGSDGGATPTPTRSSGSATSSAPTSTPPSESSSSAASSTEPDTAKLIHEDGLAGPDPDATPGSALAGVGRTQVCTRGWNATHNKIGVRVQNAVSTRYGTVAGAGTTLHLDQLIPASLGGDVTESNVWPQPQSQLKTKNELEAHLHQLVCSGQLALTTAQRAMADNWIEALRRYPPS